MRQKSFNNYKPLNLNIHHTLKRKYLCFDQRKKSEFKKKCPIFAGLSIKKLKPSSCILAENGQKMRYFKTIKPIKIVRSKEVGAWN